jgi:hypothetical protein
MLTIDQKREACIQYETNWLIECDDRKMIEDIMRDGWAGWANMSDKEVEKFYKDNIEEEDDEHQ